MSRGELNSIACPLPDSIRPRELNVLDDDDERPSKRRKSTGVIPSIETDDAAPRQNAIATIYPSTSSTKPSKGLPIPHATLPGLDQTSHDHFAHSKTRPGEFTELNQSKRLISSHQLILKSLIANTSHDLRLKYILNAVATDQASAAEHMEFEQYINNIRLSYQVKEEPGNINTGLPIDNRRPHLRMNKSLNKLDQDVKELSLLCNPHSYPTAHSANANDGKYRNDATIPIKWKSDKKDSEETTHQSCNKSLSDKKMTSGNSHSLKHKNSIHPEKIKTCSRCSRRLFRTEDQICDETMWYGPSYRLVTIAESLSSKCRDIKSGAVSDSWHKYDITETSVLADFVRPKSPIEVADESTLDDMQDQARRINANMVDVGPEQATEPMVIWRREDSPPLIARDRGISISSITPSQPSSNKQPQRLKWPLMSRNTGPNSSMRHLRGGLADVISRPARPQSTIFGKLYSSTKPLGAFEKGVKLISQLPPKSIPSFPSATTKGRGRDDRSRSPNGRSCARALTTKKPVKNLKEARNKSLKRDSHLQSLETALCHSKTEIDKLRKEFGSQTALLESTISQLEQAQTELKICKTEISSQPRNHQEAEIFQLRTRIVTLENKLLVKEVLKSERKYVHSDLYAAAPEMFPRTHGRNMEAIKTRIKNRPSRKVTFSTVLSMARMEQDSSSQREINECSTNRLTRARGQAMVVSPQSSRSSHTTNHHSTQDSIFDVQSTSEEQEGLIRRRFIPPDPLNKRNLRKFDRSMGIPKNAIPCLSNMQLGYRDGTKVSRCCYFHPFTMSVRE